MDADIVSEFVNHIINFVEQPLTNGLPVCPFARRARTKNLILFKVLPLTYQDALQWIKENCTTHHEVMIIINNDKTNLSEQITKSLADQLNSTLPTMGLQAFWGHPEALFCVNGVFTRREPFPNIQVIKKSVVERADKLLQATDYYDKWTKENLDEVKLS